MKRFRVLLVALAAAGTCWANPAVVGGEEASQGAYPWLVALLRADDGPPSPESLLCAGTAIGPNLVLTAAHCLFGEDGFPLHPRQVQVLAGSDTLSGDDGILLPVERIRVHEGFSFSLNLVKSDIALLHLPGGSGLDAVEWNRQSTEIEMRTGEAALVAGWGARSPDTQNPDFPDRLHQAEVLLISAAECAATYQAAGISLAAEHLCAGLPQGGVDFCSRDAGAPLFLQSEGGPLQLAIASFGGGECGDPNLPGVYTRTDSLLPWLQRHSQSPLYFAQFGNGGGLASDIVLVNPSASESVAGELVLLDAEGNSIDGAANFEAAQLRSATVSGTAFNLAPGGSITFAGNGEGDLVQGSATVFSEASLDGVTRFQIAGIGIAGVGASRPATEVAAPARNRDGIRTGLAIRNTGGAPVRVDLSLKTEDGELLPGATVTETIAADGRFSRFIDEIFAGNEGLEGFRGTVIARAQDGLIAAVALELGSNPGEFTTLPVIVVE